MEGYLVQMHMHVSETSACAKFTAAEMVRAAKELGYSAVVITDHFINANIGFKYLKDDSGEPLQLSWAEKVEYQFRGYHAAKAEGDRIGITVLPAWETFTNGPEYLTYGLDEAFLLSNPDIADVPKEEYCARCHAAGAYLIHAHPYRQAPYIPLFEPDVSIVEGVEIYNAGNREDSWNRLADELAVREGKYRMAGSDAHWPEGLKKGAMLFPHAITTIEELIDAMRNGEGTPVTEI